MSATINRCPRCDQAACPAAGFTGPGSVARTRGWEPGRPACEGEPVDWRARALDAEADAARLREAVAALIESYDLAMAPASPLPPAAKDVVRGSFFDVDDARAALAAAKGETGGGMSDELKAER